MVVIDYLMYSSSSFRIYFIWTKHSHSCGTVCRPTYASPFFFFLKKKTFFIHASLWVEMIRRLIIGVSTAINWTVVLSDYWCMIALNLHEADVCVNVKWCCSRGRGLKGPWKCCSPWARGILMQPCMEPAKLANLPFYRGGEKIFFVICGIYIKNANEYFTSLLTCNIQYWDFYSLYYYYYYY